MNVEAENSCNIIGNITPNYKYGTALFSTRFFSSYGEGRIIFSPDSAARLKRLKGVSRLTLSQKSTAETSHATHIEQVWVSLLARKGRKIRDVKYNFVEIASHYHPSIVMSRFSLKWWGVNEWGKDGSDKTFSMKYLFVIMFGVRVLFNGDHEWHPSGKKVLWMKLQCVQIISMTKFKAWNFALFSLINHWFRVCKRVLK